MTTTAPPQQQAPPPAAAQQVQQDIQLAIVTAAVLATALTAAEAAAMLTAVFLRFRLSTAALGAALDVVYAHPPEALGATGPATLSAIRLNRMRQAQFLVAATRRLTQDIKTARSRGMSVTEALRDGLARERRFYGQHMEAIWKRADAAARTDSAASQYGLTLGWNAIMDGRTSPECRKANGKNFRADQMPRIGYPGAVHPRCRCWPSAPHPGAALLT